jgi:hypothetical protein
MIKILLSIMVLIFPFSSAMSTQKNHLDRCKKLASTYANVIAETQYPKTEKERKAPFKVNSVNEVTNAYFKEAGYNAKKLADMQKYDPSVVYGVSLISLDKWDCQYYVAFGINSSNKCTFKKVEFHHCAI